MGTKLQLRLTQGGETQKLSFLRILILPQGAKPTLGLAILKDSLTLNSYVKKARLDDLVGKNPTRLALVWVLSNSNQFGLNLNDLFYISTQFSSYKEIDIFFHKYTL